MKIWIVAWVIFSGGTAFAAGNKSVGGAGAYVCRGEDQQISSSHFVDLWESANSDFPWPNLGTKKILIDINKQDPMSIQISEAKDRLKKLDPIFGAAVAREILVLQASTRYINEGESISLPLDIDPNFYPQGCPPEGLMRFHGYTQEMKIDGKMFRSLASPTDVAASYIHEAIYKIYRGEREENLFPLQSRLVRRLVACIFSKECISAAEFRAPNNFVELFSCKGKNFEGRLYLTQDSKAIFQLDKLQGKKYSARLGFEADVSVRDNPSIKPSNWLAAFEVAPYDVQFQLDRKDAIYKIHLVVKENASGYAYPPISFEDIAECY
jgi:hypothetical protein